MGCKEKQLNQVRLLIILFGCLPWRVKRSARGSRGLLRWARNNICAYHPFVGLQSLDKAV